MKPPLEYRQRNPSALSSGRTPGFESGKPDSNLGAGTIKPFKLSDPLPQEVIDALVLHPGDDPEFAAALATVARYRKLNADRQRRYRQRKAKRI